VAPRGRNRSLILAPVETTLIRPSENLHSHLIRAVLFDYGGTLVRPKKPWEETSAEPLRSVYTLLHGYDPKISFQAFLELDESIFQKYSKLEADENRDIPDIVKYEEIVDRLFPNRSRAWRERVARKANRVWWDTLTPNWVIRKNARKTLAELRSMKLQLAIVSDHHNHDALTRHLSRLGISSNFSHVFSSTQMGVRKPDRRIFARCLSLMKIRRQEAIFVGDSLEYDVEGGRRASIRTILIVDETPDNQGYQDAGTMADFTIHDLREIPRIVSSL